MALFRCKPPNDSFAGRVLRRMLERRYRRTQKPSDRQQWVEHERHRHRVYRKKEQLYWSMQMSEHANQPRKL